MPKSVQLQPRDVGMLGELGEVGVLDTELAHQRHFGEVSLRRCQQRLRILHDQNLIRSIPISVWHGDVGGGCVPTIHGLTERGAEAVAAITGVLPARLLRSDPKPQTLFHRLAVVRTRLAMDDACRELGIAPPEWLMESDRRDDARPEDAPNRQRVLYHEFTGGGRKVTCQPDAASLLAIPRDLTNPPAGSSLLLGFWEIDRSTERRAQVLGKCAGYAALLEQKEFLRYWPQTSRAAVRVFFVCQSCERIASLSMTLKTEPVAQAFRFTTAHELQTESGVTAPIWQALDGSPREIIRLPVSLRSLAAEAMGHPASHLPPHVGP